MFFSASMPIGFRRELAGVRHAQLRLAREKAALEDMELDVNVGLAKAVRNLDANFQLAQTNANRWVAAQTEVSVVESQYELGTVTLDILLEAQRRRAQAQNAFWVSVAEYNKSIADLHTRKGSILEYNSIALEEGAWPEKAYFDALQRARERDAGTYFNYGWTRPEVISRGASPTTGGFQTAPAVDGMPSEITLQPEGLPRVQGTPDAEMSDEAPMMIEPMPAPAADPMPNIEPAPAPRPLPELGPQTSTKPSVSPSTGNPLRGGAASPGLRREALVTKSPTGRTDAKVTPAAHTEAATSISIPK